MTPREINSISNMALITETIKVSVKVTETSGCKKEVAETSAKTDQTGTANKLVADFLPGPQKGEP